MAFFLFTALRGFADRAILNWLESIAIHRQDDMPMLQ